MRLSECIPFCVSGIKRDSDEVRFHLQKNDAILQTSMYKRNKAIQAPFLYKTSGSAMSQYSLNCTGCLVEHKFYKTNEPAHIHLDGILNVKHPHIRTDSSSDAITMILTGMSTTEVSCTISESKCSRVGNITLTFGHCGQHLFLLPNQKITHYLNLPNFQNHAVLNLTFPFTNLTHSVIKLLLKITTVCSTSTLSNSDGSWNFYYYNHKTIMKTYLIHSHNGSTIQLGITI